MGSSRNGESVLRPATAAMGLMMLAVLGCAGTPFLGSGGDQGRYRRCDDSAASAAWARAQELLATGQDAEALPLLRIAVDRCPELIPAHLAYQDAALRLGGQPAASMRQFFEALPDGSGSPVPSYLKTRLIDSAFLKKEALDRMLAQHSSFAFAHFSMGRLMRANGRAGAAVDSFRSAAALDAQLLEARLELAETLVELGRFEEAAVHYRAYLTQAADDWETARAYVNLLVYRLRRLDEALTWIEPILRRDPTDQQALMDHAAVHWFANRGQRALDLYLEVLQHHPDNALAVLNIGCLYYETLPGDDADLRRRFWPKARQAFRLYRRMAVPESGLDYMDLHLSVPYRLQRIAELLPPESDPDRQPTIQDLLPGG